MSRMHIPSSWMARTGFQKTGRTQQISVVEPEAKPMSEAVEPKKEAEKSDDKEVAPETV